VQEELLRSEVSRLRSRLSQQERLLSGAVKRLRTTNQLKEGMEKVIIDQCRSRNHRISNALINSVLYCMLTSIMQAE
jgi:hypothetical protein